MMKAILEQVKNKMPGSLTIRQWIFISSAFSIMLLVLKILVSYRFSYAFLAWNLFLAYIPLFLSNWLGKHPEVVSNKLKLVLAIALWMLFMPNSFYIVTDLFHLQNGHNRNPWFDLTLILSFAWNGILYGIISIGKMEILLKKTRGRVLSTFVICLVMWLNAVGVYIGRFLRFNSWDVVVNPVPLFDDLADMLSNPYDYKHAWAMSVCFSLFMIIMYYTTKKLAEVFKNA
ncbi:MAG TPA: DUF1361 domain-containing protein [Chitinophagaceae bacterium]|nr:DUF1361 domain-containing protein [Chitinophagaceae bacterium]